MKQVSNRLCAMAVAVGTVGALPAAAADENVMIVFDGSNSMWGQIEGVAKIEIARGVMNNLLGDWTETRQVGLIAYGHRRRGDCSDIEILVAPGENTRAGILERIEEITPTGKTPLTSAVEQAATTLSYTDTPSTVVLISDGLESCERDPCAMSEALEQAGVGFTAHVVGFGLGDEDVSALSCIAENTGGQYLSARNADELGEALSAVGTAVAAAPEPEPEAEPEYDVTVNAPDSALTGSAFDASWTGTVHNRDYVTIVPMGADEGATGDYFRVGGSDGTNSLKAPAETGLYEVRYVLNEGKRTMASQPIEVTEPEVTVNAPDSALTGSAFDVSWTGTVHNRDYVTIVPMGADEGATGDYFRVGGSDSTNSLKAPAETGLYEVRYVLNEGKRVMANETIEITEPEITVNASSKVRASDTIRVEWTGTVHPRDYVTIVPMGADNDVSGDYFRVGDKNQHDIQAPETKGLYEMRYVLNEGKRVMATTKVEVLAADAPLEKGASLSAPETAATGEMITVGWTVDSESADQRLTVARADQAIFTWVSAVKLEGNSPLEIALPDEPGNYELRLLDVAEKKILARRTIQVD